MREHGTRSSGPMHPISWLTSTPKCVLIPRVLLAWQGGEPPPRTCVLADQQLREAGARGQLALRAPRCLRPLRCYLVARAPQLLQVHE